jgi:hypothetical protein
MILEDVEATPKASHRHSAPGTVSNRDTKKERQPTKGFRNKGVYEVGIFLAAIVTGTACSILSKILYGCQGVGKDGNLEYFNKPLFQTLTMFAAMILGIPIHTMIVAYRIPFPGYPQFESSSAEPQCYFDDSIIIDEEQTHLLAKGQEPYKHDYGLPLSNEDMASLREGGSFSLDSIGISHKQSTLPTKTYLILALLSLFDLAATALCVIGLLYLDVSVYQMLRGSGIIFVALLRRYGLGQHLYRFQCVGVSYNVLSVALVGTAALRDAATSVHPDDTDSNDQWEKALLGVAFMLVGTLVQAMQFVLEEKVMVHDDVKVPPLLLFGMEGVWGFFFSLFLLYPVGYLLPGHDHGHYEDHYNTLVMLYNTPSLQIFVALYVFFIFGYNFFAVLVTFSLSSIWHSILDNWRPLTVWLTDLALFYSASAVGGAPTFGEAWTSSSWIELVGLAVLLYGTAIYNAPDVGSLKLQGQWFAFGLDFRQEYSEIMAAETRRSFMGSYPSLHKFLSGSLRMGSDTQTSIRHEAESL